MSENRRLRMRRKEMWDKDPHCHWCGCLTNFAASLSPRTARARDAATVDHLFPRGHPLRSINTGGQRYVLACNNCNRKRGGYKRPDAGPKDTGRNYVIRYYAQKSRKVESCSGPPKSNDELSASQ